MPSWFDRYTVGFSDAYGGTHYPSSHHVALGSAYKEIYGIHDIWKTEATKVFATRARWTGIDSVDAWGIDEAYSSQILKSYSPQSKIVWLGIFSKLWHPSRLVRESAINQDTLNAVANSLCSEWHMPRPLTPASIDAACRVENAVPVYVWK